VVQIFRVWIVRIDSELIDMESEFVPQRLPNDWRRIHD
jgi:hypothetical protein